MLPLSIQVPASVVLLAGGALACFAGYRLFRLVLGVYGFILGALIGSSMMGTGDTLHILIAAAGGGVIGAVALVAGYFVGVAILGAGVGALILNVAWKPFGGEPHWAALLTVAVLGAVLAMSFQRHVIIICTAFGGAWTMMVGAAALLVGKAARAASAAGDVWVVYPGSSTQPGAWIYVAWFAVGVLGVYVQLHSGGGKSRRKK
jgi:hypothetical protein